MLMLGTKDAIGVTITDAHRARWTSTRWSELPARELHLNEIGRVGDLSLDAADCLRFRMGPIITDHWAASS